MYIINVYKPVICFYLFVLKFLSFLSFRVFIKIQNVTEKMKGK